MKLFLVITIVLLAVHESQQKFLGFGKKAEPNKKTQAQGANTEEKKKAPNWSSFFSKKNRNTNVANEKGAHTEEAQPHAAAQDDGGNGVATTESELDMKPPHNPYASGEACDPKEPELLEKINELRTALSSKIPPTSPVSNYSHDDNYLGRWLTGCQLDVKTCEAMIIQHVKWRAAAKIDDILHENFGVVEQGYVIFSEGIDKVGRPVVEWWLHDWDVAGAVENKDIGIQRLARYLIYILESATLNLYHLNVESGVCVTQAEIIVDGHQLDEAKHACHPNCLKVFVFFAQMYETHYPSLFKFWHFPNAENAPLITILKVMLQSFKHQQLVQQAFRIYKNEAEWHAAFSEKFEESEISPKFGGSRATSH